MRRFILGITILSTIVAIVFNSLTLVTTLILIIATILFSFIINKYPLKGHFAKYLVISVFWLSVVFMPSFHIVRPIMAESYYLPVNRADNALILSFGSIVFLVTSASWLLFGRQKKRRNIQYRPKGIPNSCFIAFLLFCIALSVFCFSIGLGRMGSEAIKLPFHLGGAINLFRSVFVPGFFAIVIENKLRRSEKIPKTFYLLYLFWTVIEVFAWMSKSKLILNFIPFIFVYYCCSRPNIKQIARLVIPIVSIFLLLYPLIEISRQFDWQSGDVKENIQNVKSISKDSSSSGLEPINRAFMTGYLYIQDYSILHSDKIIDLSRLPQLLLMGGAPRYQTIIIDQFPENAHHSSGTTGLIDPYLHGGIGFCIFTIVIIMFLAAQVDKRYHLNRYSSMIQLLLIIWGLSATQNISSLYDSTGLLTFFTQFLTIIVANRLNYKIAIPGNYK